MGKEEGGQGRRGGGRKEGRKDGGTMLQLHAVVCRECGLSPSRVNDGYQRWEGCRRGSLPHNTNVVAAIPTPPLPRPPRLENHWPGKPPQKGQKWLFVTGMDGRVSPTTAFVTLNGCGNTNLLRARNHARAVGRSFGPRSRISRGSSISKGRTREWHQAECTLEAKLSAVFLTFSLADFLLQNNVFVDTSIPAQPKRA